MSIKREGPRRYLVRVQFRDPKTKRKRSLEARVEGTRQDAEKEYQRLLDARSEGGRRQSQTLRAFAKSWLRSRAPSLKPSVAAKYANSLDRHIAPALGDYLLDMITPSDVQGYINARVAADASGNTVLNELRLIRTIARDSVAEGQAPRYWADRVKPPAVNTYTEEDPNLLQPAELASMLGKVRAYWRPVVTLMAFTGLRWGEASALRWDDIDEARGIIRIRRSNWKGVAVSPKTAKSTRSVPLPLPVVALLATVSKSKRRGWMFPAKRGEAAGDLIRGTPLRKALDDACTAAGVPRITPHGLRRTFNNLARQLAAREVVKAVTGHTTDAMLEHYSSVGDAEKRLLTERVIDAVTPPPVSERSGSGETEEGDDE